MSLWGHLAQWAAPFYSAPHQDRERAERQRREAERLLRQLRAELKLMRLWKADSERRDD